MDSNKLSVKVNIYNEDLGIITISGEVSVFVQDFDLLYKEISAYTKMGIYKFIMDLNGVSYIDSSGIGVVIRLATTASKQNTRICIICNQPQVRKSLTVSNVDKIVHYVETIDEGKQYFANAKAEG